MREQRSLRHIRHLVGVAVLLVTAAATGCSDGDETSRVARPAQSATTGPSTTTSRAHGTTTVATTSTVVTGSSPGEPGSGVAEPDGASVPHAGSASSADVSATSDAMPEGTNFGFLVGANVAEGTIAIDVAELLTGDEAVVAAVEDGAIDPAEPAVDNDYYIRNRNPKVRTVKVDRFAPINVLRSAGEPDLVGTNLGGLAEEYARTVALGPEASLPVHVVVTGGVITRIDQMFFP